MDISMKQKSDVSVIYNPKIFSFTVGKSENWATENDF